EMVGVQRVASVTAVAGDSHAATPTPEPLRGAGQAQHDASGSGSRLSFAFWDEQFQLELLTSALERELSASVATLVEISRSGLALRSSMTLEPRHAPLFDLFVELPREWLVTQVEAAGRPVIWDKAAYPASPAPEPEDVGQEPTHAKQVVRVALDRPLLPGES